MAPRDIPGKCNAHLYLANEFGDSCVTIRCNLKEGHEGDHAETFDRGRVVWSKDERFVCEKHGRRLEDWCSQCFEENLIKTDP